MYENFIQIISGYVAIKYDNGDNIKMILNELEIPALEKPNALESMADDVEKDVYK